MIAFRQGEARAPESTRSEPSLLQVGIEELEDQLVHLLVNCRSVHRRIDVDADVLGALASLVVAHGQEGEMSSLGQDGQLGTGNQLGVVPGIVRQGNPFVLRAGDDSHRNLDLCEILGRKARAERGSNGKDRAESGILV